MTDKFIGFNDVHRGDVWKTSIASGRLVVVVTPHTAWANAFMIDLHGDFEHHYVTEYGTLNACKLTDIGYRRMEHKVGEISEKTMHEILSIFFERVFGLKVSENDADGEIDAKHTDFKEEYYKVLADIAKYRRILADINSKLSSITSEADDDDDLEDDDDMDDLEEADNEIDKTDEFYSLIDAPTRQLKTRVRKVLEIYDDNIKRKGAEAFNDISILRIKGRPLSGPKTVKVIQDAINKYERRK